MALVAVSPCEVAGLAISDAQVRSVLKRLDRELEKSGTYIDAHQSRIDSLQRIYTERADNSMQWMEASMNLADEYTAFNADSALNCYTRAYTRAVELGMDSVALAFRLKRATYLPLAGFVKEAVEEFGAVDAETVPEGLKELYYDSGRQMYSYIASFYLNYPDSHEYWCSLTMKFQLDLIGLLDETSDKYKLNQGEYYYASKDYSKAEAILVNLLENLPEESNMYARASHIVADIAKVKGNRNEYVYYLALSAIADVKSATLEVVSLQELGAFLFGLDDIDRAYNYLSVALANAVECHAAMRMIQTSEALPIIESAHAAELDAWRNRVYSVMAGMAVLVLVLIATLLFLRREMKRMSVLQQNLRLSNHIKEVYISQFLNLCSIYMDKLNQFNKIVNRKISTGNVDELYKITKSGKFVEEQSREFYEVFDHAFLSIYPTFVENVNELLRDDEKIVLADGELLNTDLRILAFMRLGIEESSRIAQMLNYSVYTIYTYRSKLKKRAKNSDAFETDIMKISSVE